MKHVSTIVLLGEAGMLELTKPMGEGPLSRFLNEKGAGSSCLTRYSRLGPLTKR